MHRYKVVITKTASKQLDKLPNNISDMLLDAISSLSHNPRPIGHIKLKNREGYRVRKGDYRIIYDIFDNILVVDIIAVGHRKNIYE
ncbi:MAG: type II toxin-antitoxin system RelE/ParE family toxin [Bacteroidales bacterium]